ncbi:hypothetical protein D3C81_2189920 [compost metagenome]
MRVAIGLLEIHQRIFQQGAAGCVEAIALEPRHRHLRRAFQRLAVAFFGNLDEHLGCRMGR